MYTIYVKFECLDNKREAFIQKVKENASLRCEGGLIQRREEKRSPWPNLGSSFCMFFSSP